MSGVTWDVCGHVTWHTSLNSQRCPQPEDLHKTRIKLSSLRHLTAVLTWAAPAFGTPPWNPKALPHRQDQRVETFTLGFIHLTLCARCSPATPPPTPPCQTGFSCGDDFWFHNGLLPERGGERGQTYQLRDRETAAARQERCKKGAQAASAGWVWKGWQSWPLLTTR